MKVAKVHLKYFKRFRDTGILDFRDPDTHKPKDLIVLLGNNGSGKSTILQAIAAMVGTATGRLVGKASNTFEDGTPKEGPFSLDWPGLDWGAIGDAWQRKSELFVTVAFDEVERQATREYCERADLSSTYQIPADHASVTLEYDPGSPPFVRAQEGPGGYFQFKGRQYAGKIVNTAAEKYDVFEQVGNIFWYHEQRHSLSLSSENGSAAPLTMEKLRNQLALWEGFHEKKINRNWTLRPGQRDFYEDLENLYRKIFPRHRFAGAEPHGAPDKIYEIPPFYLYDGRNEYQLEEMSAGERAIFPLLLDFVRLNIHRSIILIDELELHLHPPLQQALLFNLDKLGIDNQFIITTHSEAIASIVPDSAVYRIDAVEQ